MHAENDGLPTTESGAALRETGSVLALRWVHPTTELVTLLASSPLVLGRAPTAGARLDSASVSRQHAEVTLTPGTTPRIADLDSRNGVFVNGERVKESSIHEGDVVRLGDCVAVVEAVTLDRLAGFRHLGHGVFGGEILGQAVEQVRRAALTGTDLLLFGEDGTGKELLSRAYHRFAARPGAFVVFDCASDSETTREHELFGRSDQALQPGENPSVGHVRAAEHGTLLLDAIADLPEELQGRLADALGRREVVPVGDGKPLAFDVRFIGKSLLPFDEPIAKPLYSRLASCFPIAVTVPPLRERRGDIAPLFSRLLARHGAGEHARLEPKLAEGLSLREWPLNVRELDSVARRFAARATHAPLTTEQILDLLGPPSRPVRALSIAPSSPAPSRRTTPSYAPSELAALRAALERHAGNLTKAASELEITRSKAYRMLKIAEEE